MADEALKFTFGLINNNDKYLTGESFGFKIAASATSMKQKQIWSLEQEPNGAHVYFKSHLNRYLGTNKLGNMTCEAEEPTTENAFHVEATADGRWAIKSALYERYFGGLNDDLDCFGKEINETRLWIVHLAMHPQVNLYSLTRKKYASVADNQLQVTKMTPWGVETLITLVYKDRAYGLMTSDNRFLSVDGSLHPSYDDSTAYTLEFYSGCIAFKASSGRYLSPQGPQGAIKAWRDNVKKDEKFSLQDSHPQIHLLSTTRSKYVSIKQGVQVVANQTEPSEELTETFQMEIHPTNGKWSFRTNKDTYWQVDSNNNVMANKSTRGADSWFEVEWRGRGVRLIAANGKYIGVKSGGNLIVKSDESEAEEFVLKLINRPVIVFRSNNCFIGCQGDKLNGNKATYDIFKMVERDGAYSFQGNNGKYWSLTSDGTIAINSATPEYFLIELLKHSGMAIKPEQFDGYLGRDKSTGALVARKDTKVIWEY